MRSNIENDKLQAFEFVDYNELWRLFIDYNRQGEGKNCFDKGEPGYLEALNIAFLHLLKHLNQPLTPQAFIHLHDIAVNNVKNSRGVDFKKGINRHNAWYGLVYNANPSSNYNKGNTTLQGLTELLQKIKTDPNHNIAIKNHTDHCLYDRNFLQKNEINPEKLAQELFRIKHKLRNGNLALGKSANIESVTIILDKYYKNIANYSNKPLPENEKAEVLKIIAKCVRDLEQEHVFADGNQRTTVFLVLNKLLLENGFTPCILSDPSCFDCFGLEELVTQIKLGMHNFKNLCVKENLNRNHSAKIKLEELCKALNEESNDWIFEEYDPNKIKDFLREEKNIQYIVNNLSDMVKLSIHNGNHALLNEIILLKNSKFVSQNELKNTFTSSFNLENDSIVKMLLYNYGDENIIRDVLSLFTLNEIKTILLEKNKGGESIFHEAASHFNSNLLPFLLSYFQDDPLEQFRILSQKDENDNNIFHYIAQGGHSRNVLTAVSILGNDEAKTLMSSPNKDKEIPLDLIKKNFQNSYTKLTDFFMEPLKNIKNNFNYSDLILKVYCEKVKNTESLDELRNLFNTLNNSAEGQALRKADKESSSLSTIFKNKKIDYWSTLLKAIAEQAIKLNTKIGSNIKENDIEIYNNIMEQVNNYTGSKKSNSFSNWFKP